MIHYVSLVHDSHFADGLDTSKFLPNLILETRPSAIYRGVLENQLVIFWFVNGTVCLNVSFTNSPYTTQNGKLVLTKTGEQFAQNGRVESMLIIDQNIKNGYYMTPTGEEPFYLLSAGSMPGGATYRPGEIESK